jgi:intracellular septation protein A
METKTVQMCINVYNGNGWSLMYHLPSVILWVSGRLEMGECRAYVANKSQQVSWISMRNWGIVPWILVFAVPPDAKDGLR